MRNSAKVARGRTRPQLEALEERALLSDLSISLTTDQPIYQPGQPIQFTFTETNVSNHPVNASYGPSVDGFLVSQNGSSVWQSNAGVNPLWVAMETLQPGHSFTLKSTWDGVPNLESSPIIGGGTFTVTNQLDPGGASATFQVEPPNISYSFSTDQPVYQVGQPVQITFVETNTSDQPETVNVDPSGFTIKGFNGTVWQSGNITGSPTSETLNPGQSITQSATWNGISNAGLSPNLNQWGDFQVSDPNAPNEIIALFSIDNPLKSALASQSAVYTTGQPVVLTETMTNTSTVPITFPAPDSRIQMSNLDTSTFFQKNVAASAPIITLQPGQALTQSATWSDDDLSAISPGHYYASFVSTVASGDTEFQVASPATGPPSSLPPVSEPWAPGGNAPTPFPPTFVPPDTGGNDGANDGISAPPPSSPAPMIATLATSKSTYRIGQRMSLTFTLTNVGSQSIALPRSLNKGVFQILRGSKVIWSSAKPKLATRALQSISPGQSMQLKGTWTGKPLHAGVKTLKPGVYTLEGSAGGYTASATIQLIAPSAR